MRRRLIIQDFRLFDGMALEAYLNLHEVRKCVFNKGLIEQPAFPDMTVIGDVTCSVLGKDGMLVPIIVDINSPVCRIITNCDGPVVIGIGDMVLKLFAEDHRRLAAAVYHELGHLVVNHRYAHMVFGHQPDRVLAEEINADNYAVRHLGAVVVIDMLIDCYASSLDACDTVPDDELRLWEIELIYRIARLGHRQYRNIFMSYYSGNSKMLRKLGYRPLP